MKKISPFLLILLIALMACSSPDVETITDTVEDAGERASTLISSNQDEEAADLTEEAATEEPAMEADDLVETSFYAPDAAIVGPDSEFGVEPGGEYPIIVLSNATQTERGFLIWETEDPVLLNRLSNNTVYLQELIGTDQTFMRGDTLQMRTQDTDGGGLNVIIELFRDNSAVGGFSFVIP